MRKLWFAFAVGLVGVVSVAALTSPEPEQVSARGSRALRGGPAGVVKTTDERPVGGLMVQLISDQTSIRTTIYTDALGRYEFPVLESGSYTLRLARPLEFRRYQRDAVRIDGATPLADIIVERVADGDFLPPDPDILPQLTGAEWVANMPGTTREKEAFVTSCTVSCHSGDNPFRVRFDEASWRTLVHRMAGYHLRTLIRPSGQRGGGNADVIADWLVRIRGLDAEIPLLKPFPRPHGPATRAVVTEFELPWALVNVHDVAGDADGAIWFTINRSPFIGRLDPATGKVTSFRIPKQPPMTKTPFLPYEHADPPGIHPGAHWIQVDHHTGLVWFSDTWAMALGRLDPRTGDIQMVNTGLHGNVALSSDGLSIWRTHRGSILQYDTKTVMETGTPIREIKLTGVNSTYGNFVSHDGAYFGGGGSHIVWMDIETGEVRQVRLTAGGRGRGSFDADGNIWVGGRRLAKYDPRTGALEEYAPPSPYVNLYSAEADRNGDIWLGQQQAGRVARFNPDTHQWIEYVLPSPWSFVFNSWIDNSTDTPTFWYGDQHGYIVRIQPLPDAAGAPEPARGAPAPTGPARPLPPVDEFDRNARLWAMQRTGHESGWQRGQEIYFMRCWMCHNEYTIAADPVAAPSLRDLYTRATLATGQPVSDQTVAAHVRDGSAGMPAYTPAVISDADMSDLLVYLREKCGTFPTGGGCFDEHNPPANPHYRAN